MIWHEKDPRPVEQVVQCVAYWFQAAGKALSPELESGLRERLGDGSSREFISVNHGTVVACVSDKTYGTDVWGYIVCGQFGSSREVRENYHDLCREDAELDGILVA